jgi:hypothetical protein
MQTCMIHSLRLMWNMQKSEKECKPCGNFDTVCYPHKLLIHSSEFKVINQPDFYKGDYRLSLISLDAVGPQCK